MSFNTFFETYLFTNIYKYIEKNRKRYPHISVYSIGYGIGTVFPFALIIIIIILDTIINSFRIELRTD